MPLYSIDGMCRRAPPRVSRVRDEAGAYIQLVHIYISRQYDREVTLGLILGLLDIVDRLCSLESR